MSRLEELIQELCPDGVIHHPLEDVTHYARTRVDVTTIDHTTYVSVENLLQNKQGKTEASSVPTTGNVIGFNTGDILIGNIRPYLRKIWLADCSGGTNGDVLAIQINDRNVLAPEFLYYILSSEDFFNYDNQNAKGAKMPRGDKAAVMKYRIPVPPLEVQREIVRILDSFTLLTAELTAELTARKKQYNYYHNSLMDFSDRNIEYKSVGELFEIKNGLNKEKSAFGKGQPIINFTDVYNKRSLSLGSFNGLVDVTEEEIERYSAKKGDVFFTRTSETKEDIGMSSTLIEDIPNCVFSGFVLRARPTTDLLLPKFCSYYFSTNKVRDTIVRYAAFTTRATTTGPKLSKIMVPILPKDEQEKIVSILDRFDELCSNISNGLPAEIEARQKQYEYYRNKLLSFEEL